MLPNATTKLQYPALRPPRYLQFSPKIKQKISIKKDFGFKIFADSFTSWHHESYKTAHFTKFHKNNERKNQQKFVKSRWARLVDKVLFKSTSLNR